MSFQHFEHDLLLLMLNLSQLRDPTRITALFIEAVNPYLDNITIELVKKNKLKDCRPGIILPIATIRTTYGQFLLQGETQSLPASFLPLLNNAVRMLAVILENCHQAKLLEQDNTRLENIIQGRTQELVSTNKKLKTEIEERKRAERELRFIKFAMDHISDAAFWMDSTGKFVHVNQAACTTLEYSYEEFLSMSVYDIDPNFTKQIWPEHWQDIQTKKFFKLDTRHMCKSGRTFPVEIIVNYLEFDGEEYNCAIARDISVRKAMETQLQQAQKMEAIGTLAGGIAHDFNNILAAIIGYADMVHDDLQPGTTIWENQGEVLNASERAKDLVMQILTFSRQSTNERQSLQIHLIIKEALKLLRASIPSTIEIKEKIDHREGKALADPTQIHQILMNLCTNAYQAMRETGGVLQVELAHVTVSPTDPRVLSHQLNADNYLVLSVTDTGHGMNPQTLARVFEPYFTTKKKGEGTGMGLAVVHGIVKSHEGFIFASSEEHKGTTFSVYLPRIDSNIQQLHTTSSKGQPFGNERILIVDDELQVANLQASILTRLGYTVTTYLSSTEALANFRQKPTHFDLVVTDMTMPQMNGAQFAKALLEIRPNLPIIMITGYSEMINEKEAKAMGIKKFALKPLVPRKFANLVRNVLDSSNS